MKSYFYLFALAGAALGRPAAAQSARDLAEARILYQQANTGALARTSRAAIAQQPTGFLGDGAFEFGALRTYDGRRRPVPGLRYHAALHLLEAQDSISTDSTHLWPVTSLRGFDLGESGNAAMPLRRFRGRLVKEGNAGTRREFVEVLTAIDAGPLLLAWLYTLGEPTINGTRPVVGVLLAGPGTAGAEPLRLLEPTQSSVLHLFGSRTNDLRDFATTQKLNYTRPIDIAKMMDHYNRIAVIK